MTPAARKQKILAAIVESYIGSGEPVGSKSLIGAAGLDVSSATVRNDMAELTAQGYLAQPHTSAGRVPTAQGYRYYVDNVMQLQPLAQVATAYIRDVLQKHSGSPEEILQGAADITERLTGSVALATTPGADNCRVRRLSFVQTGRHAAMAVLICSNGVVRTRLFRCATRRSTSYAQAWRSPPSGSRSSRPRRFGSESFRSSCRPRSSRSWRRVSSRRRSASGTAA